MRTATGERVRLLVAVMLVCQQGAAQTMGPADVKALYTEKCKEFNSKVNFTMTLKKTGKTAVTMDVICDFPFPLDDRVTAKVEISIYGNGGWKPNFYSFYLKNPCDTMKTLRPEFFAKMSKDSGREIGCPVKKGVVKLNNYPLDPGGMPLPAILPYAKFRLTTHLFRDQQQVVCTHSYFDVVPKKKVVFKKS